MRSFFIVFICHLLLLSTCFVVAMGDMIDYGLSEVSVPRKQQTSRIIPKASLAEEKSNCIRRANVILATGIGIGVGGSLISLAIGGRMVATMGDALWE